MQDRVYQKKVKDVNELRQRLVEVWAGLQQNVIDDAITHRVPGWVPYRFWSLLTT